MPIRDLAGDAVRSVIRAYHGSPQPTHFDRFDARMIGKGEGAQAYGYGHYSAQDKAVADDYRRSLSYKKIMDDFLANLPQDADADEVIESLGVFDSRQQEFLSGLADEDWLGFDYPSQAISQSLSRSSGLNQYEVLDGLRLARDRLGTGYEIEIAYPESALLDWDAPLAQQSPAVQSAIAPFRSRSFGLDPTDGTDVETGATAYERIAAAMHSGQSDDAARGGWRRVTSTVNDTLQNQAAASAALQKAGIPGIRYLDGNSRRLGEGTRNYVMFPGTEDSIAILRKYGLLPATFAAEGLVSQPQPAGSTAQAYAIPTK